MVALIHAMNVNACTAAILLLAIIPAFDKAIMNRDLFANAFYIPGVHPIDFREGDPVNPRVGRVSSVRKHVPFDYYDLPMCEPAGGVKNFNANLGEVLSGDIFHNSPYTFHMMRNETCSVLCQVKLDGKSKEYEKLLKMANTQPSYRVQARIDNMPAIMMAQEHDEDDGDVLIAIGKGYPLTVTFDDGSSKGGNGKPTYGLTNHINFFILYHEVDSQIQMPTPSTVVNPVNRIIRVYVTSQSIDYSKSKRTADGGYDCNVDEYYPLIIDDGVDVVYTYSVKWISTDERWATRWDELLQMTPEDYEMNWFSVINAISITTMLSLAIAVILLRAIKKDFVLYQELDMQLQDEENIESEVFVTGWKVVARDVFRPPQYPFLLAVINGTGDQLFWMVTTLISVALFGLFNPSNRGALMSAVFFLYALLGFPAGYTAAVTYKKLNGSRRRSSVIAATALLLPGIFFFLFLCTDLTLWASKSTGAVPFATFFIVTLLWFGVTVPLVFYGASRGFKAPDVVWPCKTNAIPRQIPPKAWYLSTPMLSLMGGSVTFAVSFVQIFYVFSRMWLHEFVYMFGFIFITLILWVVCCAEVAIVATYLTLCVEDHRWWWKSIIVPGSFGGIMFAMSLIYFIGIMPSFVTTFLFVCYSFMASLVMGVVASAVGFEVTLAFVERIYGEVKVD